VLDTPSMIGTKATSPMHGSLSGCKIQTWTQRQHRKISQQICHVQAIRSSQSRPQEMNREIIDPHNDSKHPLPQDVSEETYYEL
jgi:hypothetical protein